MSKDPKSVPRRELLSARTFALSAMACPGCHATLADPVEQCPWCGYVGRDSLARFPFAAPAMERYIDPMGYLQAGARKRIDQSLTSLRAKFPQVEISICIVDLELQTDPREFGFWMFNASKVRDDAEAAKRPWTILLLIDDKNGRASVTSGYAIEPFIDEDDFEVILRLERDHFLEKDYEKGVLKFIEEVTDTLREGARRFLKLGRKKSSRVRDSHHKGGWA